MRRVRRELMGRMRGRMRARMAKMVRIRARMARMARMVRMVRMAKMRVRVARMAKIRARLARMAKMRARMARMARMTGGNNGSLYTINATPAHDQCMISATPISHLPQNVIPEIPPSQLRNSRSIRFQSAPPHPSFNSPNDEQGRRAGEVEERMRGG